MDKPDTSTLTVTVAVDPSLGDPERYRHDIEQIVAAAVTLLAIGMPPFEVKRRLRGYEPREAWEVSP